MKMVAGLDNFDGTDAARRDWQTVFVAYCSAMSAAMGRLMKLAAQTDDVVDTVGLDAEEETYSAHLYWMLVMKCKGTALDKVITAGEGEGLVAWRALYKHYEPRTPQTSTAMLLELLTWDFSGVVIDKIAKFDRARAKYQDV